MKLLLSFLIIIFSSAYSYANDRFALVIGNSNYQLVGKLKNPLHDAADMSASLKRLGFEVTTAIDLDFTAMRRELGKFNQKTIGADVAIIFYAGHGIEVNKQNYLIPTDAQLKTDSAISFETIPLELMTEAVSGAKGLKLVMLDSCRNNPFSSQMKISNSKRTIGRGLAPVEPNIGTLVSFAAREGTTADDGDGRNSPYTKALLKHLEEPGLEIGFLFRQIRDSVMEDTANQQEPFVYGSLSAERIYLNPKNEIKPNDVASLDPDVSDVVAPNTIVAANQPEFYVGLPTSSRRGSSSAKDWKAVQQILATNGVYSGAIDGKPGPMTFRGLYDYLEPRMLELPSTVTINWQEKNKLLSTRNTGRLSPIRVFHGKMPAGP